MATPSVSNKPDASPLTSPDSSELSARSTARPKKKLVRRVSADRSQRIRRIWQFAFVALNLWIGFEFYRWVRFYETMGGTPYVERPAGIDGWLPIDGLMNLKFAVLSGTLPKVHPAGMFLLTAFLAISLLLRKAFCSWLCPIGTLSEYLWKLGRKLFRGNLHPPRWLDITLRGLKYLLLAFFVWVIGRMSLEALIAFVSSPYGIIADVKMLNFFRHIGQTGAIVLASLVLLSIVIQNFWCRYLCPYGALMGLLSLFSPARIRREPEPCIDCGKCAKACPSSLSVDHLIQIRSAECTACMECVAACPAEGALQLSFPRKRNLSPWAVAACIAVIFFGLVGYARMTDHWKTRLPVSIYMRLVPEASLQSHPGI